jgi:hypothetical protein
MVVREYIAYLVLLLASKAHKKYSELHDELRGVHEACTYPSFVKQKKKKVQQYRMRSACE